MELNEKNEELVTINIFFGGKISKIECNYKMNFEEVISLFLKMYLNINIDLDKIQIKVNEKTCFLEEILEFYKDDIKKNSIFKLSYKNQQENKENEIIIKNNIDINDFDKITIEEHKIPLFNGIKRARDNICLPKFRYKDTKPITIKEIYANTFDFEINIKFIKTYTNIFNKLYNLDLFGLLKLCLLKEIALLISDIDKIKNLPDYLSNIITILKRGTIECSDIKEDILKILKKIKGGNIINFSNYVDSIISQSDINKYLISLFDENKRKEISYIQNCLGKYIEYTKIFEKEFERAKRNSVFEYSVISLTIIEREDINNFEKNRKKCDNRIDRVLFHGTSYDSISCILTDLFRKSDNTQHGKGVYFTEDLDSCWIYGSEKKNKNKDNNKRNLYVPKVGEFFSCIVSAIYYDKNGFKRVYDDNYTPKKNEINFAYAEMKGLNTILEEIPDKTKFYGTEYVINNMEQICPFISLKLKRDEYCVIWRDNNFSSKPVYCNKFDKIFKNFLKERLKYINQMAKFNIYLCETSEEALKLISRKKYNKIILISNIGTDLEGKKFIINARKIIGNEVIALFLAYNIEHLNWVKNFKNSLFSNEPHFYEKYLDCFFNKNENECKNALKELISSMEIHYKVKFNFDNKFLDYPYFNDKKINKFCDLSF